MDISNIGRFFIPIKGLGEVKCGSLRVRELDKVEEYLAKGTPEGAELTRLVFASVSQKKIDGKEDEYGPLDEKEVRSVSSEDLEKFAEQFLAHNPYLYKEPNTGVRDEEDETGRKKRTVKKAYSEVSIPREEGEAATNYLCRVIQAYFRDFEKQMSKVLSSVTLPNFTKGLFSTDAIKSIRDNVDASARLSATLGSLSPSSAWRDFAQPSIKPVEMTPRMLPDISEDPAYETNRRLSRLIGHVEELSPLLPQSAELLQTMSNAVLEMQADLYVNAKKATKWNFIVISVAAISLAVTAAYSWWSYQSYQEDREQAIVARQNEEGWRSKLLRQDQASKQQLQALLTSVVEGDAARAELLLKALKVRDAELIEILRELQKADSQTVSSTGAQPAVQAASPVEADAPEASDVQK